MAEALPFLAALLVLPLSALWSATRALRRAEHSARTLAEAERLAAQLRREAKALHAEFPAAGDRWQA